MKYLDRLLKIKENKGKILIVGLGKENQQFLEWATKVVGIAKESISISDQKLINNTEYTTYTGLNYLDCLSDQFDIVVKAPGIWSLKPELEAYRTKNGQDSIISSMVFFLESFRDNILMVTGTKGKTTTSSWTKEILQKTSPNLKVEYCGNTSNISPYQFWNNLEQSLDNYIFVIETSSFQLQDLGYSGYSPKYAIITNLFIDHLDQHKDKEEYWQAKENIFLYQNQEDFLVITDQVAEVLKNYQISIPSQTQIINQAKIQELIKTYHDVSFIGNHNWSNLALVISVVNIIICKDNDYYKLVKELIPPKGRLELVRTIKKSQNIVNIYNDNTATEPDAIIAALKSLCDGKDSQTILILAGKIKKSEYQELINLTKSYLRRSKILKIYYFGPLGQLLQKAIENKQNSKEDIKINLLKEFLDLPYNLKTILKQAKTQNINILFSPGGSSFDEFDNYSIREECYLNWVKRIGHE